MNKSKDLKSSVKKYGIKAGILIIYFIIVDLLPDNPFVLAFSLLPLAIYIIKKFDIELGG